jgi:hypothetical protein
MFGLGQNIRKPIPTQALAQPWATGPSPAHTALLGIPTIHILEAWEFPEYTNVLLEKSQQYWEFPLYKYERCGNSQSILIFLQGIPIVHS